MTVLLAIAVTAIVVGACAVVLTQRSTRATVTRSIGGRSGANPVAEHERLMRDVQQSADEAASRSDLLERALQDLPTGVVVTDAVGNVVVRNTAASRISERSHEQTLVEAGTAELQATALQGHEAEREIEVFGPPARVLLVRATPIFGRIEVVGSLVIIADVTDHHRIDKTRRDFVANLSHELRTPVGAVSLLSEMLVGEQDDDTVRQLTDRLLLETDRMTDTIDGLLELSRIEADTQPDDETFVVQELIDEAVARTRVAAEAKQVHVAAEAPGEPILVRGKRDQLRTAVVNLVENAIKYSDADDSVRVRSRAEADTLALTVQDTGRGIPARDLDRIFERFYRVDRSRDAQTGGTGIGLSIVRHVALNHGGTVSVKSFEGDGSTFTLSLPIVERPVDDESRRT